MKKAGSIHSSIVVNHEGLEELEGLKGFEGTEELRKLNPSTLSSLIQSSTVPSGTIVPRQVWPPHS